MKFILISPKNRTTYNFRGDLIKEIISCGYEVIVTGPNRDDIDKIEELGVRFVEIPINKNSVNFISDLKYMSSLKKLFKKEKPDITFGYTIKPVIYGAIAAKRAGVKNIYSMVTGAGYVFTGESFKAKIIKFIVKLLSRYSFKRTNAVIFQNPDDLELFVNEKLLRREKCKVVYGSGVNLTKFKPEPYPKDITFFMLSRIMKSKGVIEYLEAAKKVKEFYPSTRFMLLGAIENIQDSLTYNDLKPYIDDKIIDYFGETSDVSFYYKQCSVYVLPSYREGTPRTVLEAMAMARPIITTDTPGCRETVIEEYNGFLVPVNNSDALANRMNWFIENNDMIEEMGQNSLNLCKEKFDVNIVNKQMLEYLNINCKGE